MKAQTHIRRSRGFTLIITMSLMILLAIIAVGMLSLSSVTLRSASHASAMSEARANARMALMVALGELQKFAGPDRAITATSEILSTTNATPAKPNVTGVWESWWDFNPNSAPDYAAEKTRRFRRWLVSSADPVQPTLPDFINTQWPGRSIELVGNGTLGTGAAEVQKVRAGLVPVTTNGRVQGSYGWHVADESVKARINLYRDPNQRTTIAQRRALLTGQRPNASVVEDVSGAPLAFLPNDLSPAAFTAAQVNIGKILDLDQAELLDQARGKIKPLRHHITPYSLGVMADVRGGTLKQDLSSIFELGSATSNTLPADFTNRRLYASTHGITGISDPNWSALAGYYNSYRNISRGEVSPTVAMRTVNNTSEITPTGYNPAPVIAKVDTIFSLVARPTSDVFWINGNANVRDFQDYHLNLIFTPVVTLHNPYNVNISFHKMEVSFENIPVAFNIMFQAGGTNGFISQSVEPGKFESINTMNYDAGAAHNGRSNKTFVMNIANWSNSEPLATSNSITDLIVMRPGQTLICGPSFAPGSSFQSDSGRGSNTIAFDWDNRLTKAIKALPVYTPGVGFEMYATAIAQMRKPGGVFPGGWSGHPFMMLRGPAVPKISKSTVTDRFYVEFKIQRPSAYADNSSLLKNDMAPTFAVNARIQANATSAVTPYARLQFDYRDDRTLRNVFNDRVYRYPPTTSLSGPECAAPPGETYARQFSSTHPFAIFSAYTRTTNGGVFETGQRTRNGNDSPQVNLLKDGRLAGSPFLFHNPSLTNFTMDLATQKLGVQAYELNFQPFLSKGDFQDYMDVDSLNRVPSLSGNRVTTGIKAGSYLEVPSGPLITIADFRRSNALASSHLPHFVQPVSNSRLHPLMSPQRVVETNPLISPNSLLDHSFLANHALYDRFYFSTFASRGATRPDAVFEQFMNGTAPLALQAYRPFLPSGRTIATARSELYTGSNPAQTAYRNAAEYQMIRGPFNVNSTSVQAWKAQLAAMKQSEVTTLWARNSAMELRNSTGTPIPGMSLPNGSNTRNGMVATAKIDNIRTNDWNGYREITDDELEILAQRIVDEVRDRGPFLSLAEFINRQIGTSSPRTLRGALEAAIEKAEINERQNAVFPDTYLNQVPVTVGDVSDPQLYSYTTPQAITGNPAAGAPGWVNQGDLLRIIEPSATVRGDTFVIRSYGEAQDASGKITARAFAEAVVQRTPEYVEPINRPSLNVHTDPSASPTNKTFGRRFNIASFRWLANQEI